MRLNDCLIIVSDWKMSDIKKKHKCFFDLSGDFQPCPGLSKVICWTARKGIICPELINLSTGETYNSFVVYKKTVNDKGIIFNVCPFCAEKILNEKKKLNTRVVPYYD